MFRYRHRILQLFLICSILYINCAYFNTFYNAQKYYKEGIAASKINPQQAKRNFEQAIEKSALVIRNYPRSRYVPQALFIIGMSYFYMGEYTKAISKFENLLLLFPETKMKYKANLYWAEALLRRQDYDLALERLTILKGLVQNERVEPELNAEVSYKRAEIYFTRNRYEEAKNELSEIITNYPKSNYYLPGLLLKGKISLAEKNYSQALLNFRECQKLIDQKLKKEERDTSVIYTELLINLAKAYMISGQESLALEFINNLLLQDSMQKSSLFKNDRIYLELGDLYTQINRFIEAREYYRRVTKFPEVVIAHWRLAQSYEEEAMFDSAVFYYQKIVDRPESTEFRISARARLELLKTIFPDTLTAHDEIGKTTNQKTKKEKSDTLNPQIIIDDTLEDQGKGRLNNASILIDNAKIQFHRAEIYYLHLKDYQKALIEYEKVYREYPKSSYAPKALLACIWIYRNVLQISKADSAYLTYQKLFDSLIRNYPETPYAQEALKILKDKRR
jgi:tetratricopeptide (TPR) repeat protein